MVGFWSTLHGLLSTLFHVHFHKDARHALLHCTLPGLHSYQQKLATYLFIAAKHAIARAWRKPLVVFAEVKSILTILMLHEKMTSVLHDSHAKFLKVWNPWWSYALPILPPTSLGIPNRSDIPPNPQPRALFLSKTTPPSFPFLS